MGVIEQMTYRPVGTSTGPVEVLSFERLRRLNGGGTQRADFHVVAVLSSGSGGVLIDFERYFLTPRSTVWIPPGAVHCWEDITDVTGRLVLFVPTAPVTHAIRQLVATPWLAGIGRIAEREWDLVSTAVTHLQLEVDAAVAGTRTEIPELLLSALLARLEPPRSVTSEGDTTFRKFQVAVEEHFRDHHDAGHYARALGWSPRTLSRSVLRATGRTAKAYITDRVVLEAKRMLVHDRFTAARCANELGFLDAAKFSAFFLSATGERPGAWQAKTSASA